MQSLDSHGPWPVEVSPSENSAARISTIEQPKYTVTYCTHQYQRG